MSPNHWKTSETGTGHHAGQPDFEAEPPASAFKKPHRAVAPVGAHNTDRTSVSAWVPVYTTIGQTLRKFPEVGKLVIEALEREHPDLFTKEGFQ